MFDKATNAGNGDPVVADDVAQGDGELPSLAGLLTEHAPKIIDVARKRPELVVIGAAALVAYKRSAGFRNFINRLLGGSK